MTQPAPDKTGERIQSAKKTSAQKVEDRVDVIKAKDLEEKMEEMGADAEIETQDEEAKPKKSKSKTSKQKKTVEEKEEEEEEN